MMPLHYSKYSHQLPLCCLELTHWPLGDVTAILKVEILQNSSLGTYGEIATQPHYWEVIFGSGNGLVPLGNRPLFEPMLTQT